MPDLIKDIERKGQELVSRLTGGARKAADNINKAPAKMDAEVKKQTGEDKKDDSKGKDAGELGKKWDDTFHF